MVYAWFTRVNDTILHNMKITCIHRGDPMAKDVSNFNLDLIHVI